MGGVSRRLERASTRGRAAAIGLVYTAAVVQCMAQVSFAASATVLKERLAFTDTQYGAIFLPQIALAALGAIAGGALARGVGLRLLLILGTSALALSQGALAASIFVPRALAFPVVLLGTALMGLGAGGSAAPMNSYPQLLFPNARESALVALHALNGAGLAVAPLLVGLLLGHGAWLAFPVLVGLANLALVLLAPGTVLADHPHDPQFGSEDDHAPVRTPVFWAFVGMAFFYALTESSFANWAVIFLREDKGVAASTAALGLGLFWAALTVGRLIVAVLVRRIRAEWIWLSLPMVMLATLVLLPDVGSPSAAVSMFALAGLGCSAFFPLTIGAAGRRFPRQLPWVAAMVYAGLAVGVGTGSFAFGVLRGRFALSDLYRAAALYPLVCLALVFFARPQPNNLPTEL